MEQRVRQGDFFQLASVSSLAVTALVRILVRFDDGRFREFQNTNVSATNRTASVNNFGNIETDGAVVRATIAGIAGDPKRGQIFYSLKVRDRNEIDVGVLIHDYLYGNHVPSFPNVVGPGPGHGEGFKEKRAVADDIAPIDIQEPLAVNNAMRRIDGFIWYYHCSGDTATRTLRATLRDLGEGLPTNMTSGANTQAQIWPSAGALSLIANEEGTIVVLHDSFAVSVDNGVATWENNTTAPNPFPYWANENDVGEIFFDVTSANAADRHSIYIIQEEWID